MDQWTAKSIDLLWHPQFLLFQGHRVSPLNSVSNYLRYCEILELLSEVVAASDPEDVEMKLFSQGRGQGSWRNYVIQNWNPRRY